MKKRVLTVLVAIVMLVALYTPSDAGKLTTAQRVERIWEQYGVPVRYDEHGAGFIGAQLSEIEAALAVLGPIFTKRISAITVVWSSPELSIYITGDVPVDYPQAAGFYHITAEQQTIHLYPSKNYLPTAYDIVHEFGHAACYLSDGRVDVTEDLKEINGDYIHSGHLPDRYVSAYAATNVWEDFAELFAALVIHGGEKPSTAPEGSVLRRKLLSVQGYLVEQLGPQSLVSQRASAHLGIEL